MTDTKFHAYSPRGPVALLPSAYGQEFPSASAPTSLPYEMCGKAAVVRINGPLTMAGAPICDTYDDIVARVQAALDSEAETVVLRISSPGGDVFGCFDCARSIRRMAEASGKKLISFSEANMCSSAYAIGAAGNEIVISDTASIGSIGVIATAMDLTKQDQAMGIGVALVTSGAHKADNNPHTPFTAEMRDAMQVSVDAMASVFFEHVGTMRGSRLSAAGAQALEAGVAVGASAVQCGLADRISSWDELISSLNAVPEPKIENAILPSAMAEPEKDKDEKKEDAVRASLVTASESDDPKKAARAKSALKAYDDGEDEKAVVPEKKEEAVSAASDDDEKKALKATVSALSASVRALQAEQQAAASAKAASERASFLASRPDLTKEQLAAFGPLSLDQVKAIVATLPPPREFSNPYVARSVPAVAGSTEQYTSNLSAEAQSDLDNRFGIAPKVKQGVQMNGVVQQFGVSVPIKAQ